MVGGETKNSVVGPAVSIVYVDVIIGEETIQPPKRGILQFDILYFPSVIKTRTMDERNLFSLSKFGMI